MTVNQSIRPFQSPSNRVNIPNINSPKTSWYIAIETWFQSPSNRVNIPNIRIPRRKLEWTTRDNRFNPLVIGSIFQTHTLRASPEDSYGTQVSIP